MITSHKGSIRAPPQELHLDGRADPTNRPASDGTRKTETLVNTNSFPAIFKIHVKGAKSPRGKSKLLTLILAHDLLCWEGAGTGCITIK